MIMEDDNINVICNNFWEFKKLLKLLYSENYTFFGSKQKHGAFYFWLLEEARGLEIDTDREKLFLISLDQIDYTPNYLTYKWYLKIR